jgi:prephenate dehydrogenase
VRDLHFERVTIIGVGLLGGSLGLALKHRGMVDRVIGIGRRQSSLDAALSVGAIDTGALELSDEAAAADLVVLAVPAAQAVRYLDTLRDRIGPDTVVTDVVSTKGVLCAHAQATWTAPSRFVGSHPMAGSEKWGPEHADADLYRGAVTFVEEGAHLDARARATVCALWEALGSSVAGIDPALHDRLVAATSHIPHIVASAIAQGLPEGEGVKAAVGPGFRDTTRVAEGRPELWRDICLTNRAAVEAELAQLEARLRDFGAALAAEDSAALDAYFERGCSARKRALDE